MRTQQDIAKRFEEVDDFLGTQRADLAEYMEFETIKPFLKKEAIAKYEYGEERLEAKTDPKKEILDYLDFAYEKAENERGLSATRSLYHFRSWIWLDDEALSQEFERRFEKVQGYGINVLDWIAETYGFVRNRQPDEEE